MVRAVLGVIAGYLIFAVSAVALFQLSGRDPHAPTSAAFMVASIVYGMAFACFGGFVAQAIARRGDLRTGYGLSILIAVIAAISILADRSHVVWSAIGALLLMSPCAILGAALARRRSAVIHTSVNK